MHFSVQQVFWGNEWGEGSQRFLWFGMGTVFVLFYPRYMVSAWLYYQDFFFGGEGGWPMRKTSCVYGKDSISLLLLMNYIHLWKWYSIKGELRAGFQRGHMNNLCLHFTVSSHLWGIVHVLSIYMFCPLLGKRVWWGQKKDEGEREW